MHEQDPSSTARTTPADIHADQRESDADERETALDVREERIRAREATSAERLKEAQGILADADERDGDADARDSRANDRDRAASLQSFLRDEDFTTGVKARRSAGLDRSDSKDDRTSAADDRSRLTHGARTHSDVEDGTEGSE